MNRRPLFLAGALLALSIPASAGVVTVGSLSASQYTYPYFAAMVQATGTVPLSDVHLVVNGTTVVQPDKVEQTVLDGQGTYVVYRLYKYAAGVVKPGDTLTAVVRDADADSDAATVPCTAGSTRRKSQEAAVCR